ncbi:MULTISPECIES: DUF7522 family protein [Salinibaculum]|uniref:DUF7522 family protein n=1 Tax=Salinibaculum TaxID=2732368 RepID=UPI0030D204CA
MPPEQLTEAQMDDLLDATEGIIDGHLRSITHFTEDSVEQIYLQDYLEANADLESFATAERPGLDNRMDHRNTELGGYECSIRVFERGYLVSVVADGHGVFVTADKMELERFEELGEALRETLEEIAVS